MLTESFTYDSTKNGYRLHYVQADNLGSWTTITDSLGNVVERNSFDAWGNRRNAATWSGTPNSLPGFDRGYTGHEHLYDFGLINMNGRMYDPVLSSFLSPDRYMQDPTTQQGFNRYAYCMYNPLKYVDPSGERIVGPDPWFIEALIAEEVVNHARRYQYDIAMASNGLTQLLSSNLYSHGHETNGSGNHGAAGGGSEQPHVDVTDNGDGTYTVIDGEPNSDCSVYVIDDEGNRTLLGTMLTPYSFFNNEGKVVKDAIIYQHDKWGQNKLDEFQNDTPWPQSYLFGDKNGLHGGYYDLKVHDPLGSYHGMFVDFGDGIYITTTRDLGNVFAGYEAGFWGLPYNITRFAMDGYQWLYTGGPEPPVSRLAQDFGYNLGVQNSFSLTIKLIIHLFWP